MVDPSLDLPSNEPFQGFLKMQRIRIPFRVSEFHQRFDIPLNKPFDMSFLTFKNPVKRVFERVFNAV